jgi:hypothetical protein
MATVLEECITEEQRSVVRFFCEEKNSMQRIFIKKCFLFMVGSVSSCKAVHNWVKKFSQGRSKVADDARPGAEVAETTAKMTSMLRVSTHW